MSQAVLDVETITVRDILDYTGGELISGSGDAMVGSISTDSRTIEEGQLFISLKGDNFDGRDFIGEALAKGGAGFVSTRGHRLPEEFFGRTIGILVDDTTRALGAIAGGYRSKFDLTVIGVTGSNGKTTTKDMIACISSSKYETLKSHGTYNNRIGLPLTLLGLQRSHEVAVLEMGASGRGDIAYLASIARPGLGVITNISFAHYGFFKSIESVAGTKEELLVGLAADRMAILNGDDKYLVEAGKRHRGPKLFFGLGPNCNVRAVDVRIQPDGRPRFRIEMENGNCSRPVLLGAVGYHNVSNALAAAAAGRFLRIDLKEVADSLDGYEGPPMRMQRSTVAGITIINDAYNANPASVEAALVTFASMDVPGRKFVLMGEMLELGEISRSAHRRIGELIADLGLEGLVGVGSLVSEAVDSCRELSVSCADKTSSREEAVEILAERLKEGDALLIKGSRKNRLEGCLDLLRARLGED